MVGGLDGCEYCTKESAESQADVGASLKKIYLFPFVFWPFAHHLRTPLYIHPWSHLFIHTSGSSAMSHAPVSVTPLSFFHRLFCYSLRIPTARPTHSTPPKYLLETGNTHLFHIIFLSRAIMHPIMLRR